MPLGRFRKNPREMDPVERRVSAMQYPEGSLVLGMGAGLVVPLLAFPELSALGPLLGGVVGYLAGHRLKQLRIDQLRDG